MKNYFLTNLEIFVNLKNIKDAIKKNLSNSIPFLEDIAQHIMIANQNFSRSSFLFECAKNFSNPDEKITDIGITLEFLYTATSLHRHINDLDSSRRKMKYAESILGSEASVLIGDYLLSKSFRILTKLGDLEILECVSSVTKNISRAQVMEISKPTLLVTPKYWHKVIKNKIAGLYGAGAQSAAHWAKVSNSTALKLFTFGEHYGIAAQIKKDIDNLWNKKIIYQKLNEKELWSPICYLLHDCIKNDARIEIVKKLKKNFDIKETSEEFFALFKKFELEKKLTHEAILELNKARSVLEKMEIDTTKIVPLTIFSNL